MKILIIHYRYYQASGPERYLFNIMELLESKGHEVIPFSLKYKKNISSKFSEYFPEPIGSKSEFHYSAQENIHPLNQISIIKNAFYNSNVYRGLDRLIKNEKPDIAYVFQFWGKLSSSIIQCCYDNKIPIVLRLSDYGLICSKYIFYRNGEICTKCLDNKIHGALNKCVSNSVSKSIVNYMLLQNFYLTKMQNKINTIIVPSKTMYGILSDTANFKNIKIKQIATFLPKENKAEERNNKNRTKYDFCYSGRIAIDKGVHVLINSLLILSKRKCYPKTLIVGDNDNDYAKDLEKTCKYNKLNVSFTGYKQKSEVLNLVRQCNYLVVPSVWYDNMPNALIEAQSVGVPCIVSNIGSLPELVINGKNGYLFKPADSKDLALKLRYVLNIGRNKIEELQTNSVKWAKYYCDENIHYKKLIGVFNESITQNGI
jgi:glycosyltransferase involved in cell wall biosynthesis